MDRGIWQHLLDNDAFGLVANADNVHALRERDDKVGCGGLCVDCTACHIEDVYLTLLRDARDEELVALRAEGDVHGRCVKRCGSASDSDRERLVYGLAVGVETHRNRCGFVIVGECCQE